MSDWDQIFTERGRVFTEPHSHIDRVVNLIQDKDGSRVLDLGCGTGRHVVYLSRLGFDVYGFDVSQQALSMTTKWLDEENLKADLRKHRMEDTFPYDDNFFDAVISTQVIHHNMMNDIRKTIKEIERVLRPNGLLFVTFPVFHPGPVDEDDDWELVEVEDGTYIPNKGWESGIPHHYFTMDEIPIEFGAFDIYDIFLDETRHRCVIAELKPD
ncbi:MAG: class I SAM-dependent methyltransferase [Candidatus Thorarchaeota archaeon]|jgi:ubiquinone/menaquinone biosynthesis C-methylase UbiE